MTRSSQSAPHALRNRFELPGTLLAFTLATGAEQWTGSGLNVVLPDLTGTLSGSSDEASWAITIYAVAFAFALALSHRLASYFGNRRLLVLSCGLYAAASVGCAASPSLGLFLFSRVLQGFAGGAFLVRALVFITHRFERGQRAASLRLYAVGFFFLGRFLAPIASGWFSDTLSWRVLFLVNVPLVLAAAWLFHTFAAEHWRDDVETGPPDLPGIALLAVGMSALQITLSRGEIDDWFGSPLICVTAALAVAGNLLFAAWQLAPANRHPLLHLSFLRDAACCRRRSWAW